MREPVENTSLETVVMLFTFKHWLSKEGSSYQQEYKSSM